MNQRFYLPILLAAVFVIAVTQSGCKESILVDANLSPSDNELGVFDTSLSCTTNIYYDDTAVTGYYISGLNVYQGVGAIEDPFFGTMSAASYFQLLPVNANISVYENKTIDSAVLVLPYTGFSYGDTANQSISQSYQVYFLNEELSTETVYYSSTTKEIDATNPLSDPVTVNLYGLKDSLSVAGKSFHPGLRIKLKLPNLLTRLLPALTDAGTAAAAGGDADKAFHNVFKGLNVRVADSRVTTTAIPYFRLNGDGATDYSGAGVLVYYHSNSGAADTLTQRYFFSGEKCGFFNNIAKSYSRYPINKILNSVTGNDSIIALQNQPGPNIEIKIPGIKSLPSGMIVKAELQLTLLPWYEDARFASVTRLYPLRVSNGVYPEGTVAGQAYNVMDRYPTTSLTPFDILDGRLHSDTRNGVSVKTYTIGLPREVMSSIQAGNDIIHLKIGGTQDFYGAFRMIVGGGNHPDSIYRAKLFVVYSALNK